jgi:hypothetical protein
MRLIPTTTLDQITAITQVTLTGTTSSGSPTVTGLSPSTATIVGALGVSGTGIPSYCYVNSIDSSTQVTLTQNATANGTVAITFTLEPVSLAEAKMHARVELPNTDPAAPLNNALLAGYIRASRLYCEMRIKSAILSQQWTLYLDSFPSAGGYYNRAIREIWPSLGGLPSGLGFYPGLVPNSTGVIDIPLPPLQAVNAVTYWDFAGNLQTVSPAAYNVSLGNDGRIQPQYSTVWPISRPTIDSVQISFTAGMCATAAGVPENIKIAIAMMVAGGYENREATSADGTFMIVPMGVDAMLSVTDPGIYA